MRDLALVGFLARPARARLKRPFLFALAYIYVDIVSPQRLSYYLLNSISVSMIVAALAIGAWLVVDRKDVRLAPRQGLMLLLLAYVTWTTLYADFPVEAWTKWDWVWKALVFAIFLPFTLRTRLRIEAALLFLTLSAAAIIIVGGIKTVLSGGGYGVLNLMVDNNSGLYESSTISTIAIALIPLILWFTRFGTHLPARLAREDLLLRPGLRLPADPDRHRGAHRPGLHRRARRADAARRQAPLALHRRGGLARPRRDPLPARLLHQPDGDDPGLPGRPIRQYPARRSGPGPGIMSQDHPLGGGFEAYRQNRIQVSTVDAQTTGDVSDRLDHAPRPTRAAPITAPISRCSASRASRACSCSS